MVELPTFYRSHTTSPPPVPNMSHINQIHTFQNYTIKTFYSITPHLHLGLARGYFNLDMPTKISHKFFLSLSVLHIMPIWTFFIWSYLINENCSAYKDSMNACVTCYFAKNTYETYTYSTGVQLHIVHVNMIYITMWNKIDDKDTVRQRAAPIFGCAVL